METMKLNGKVKMPTGNNLRGYSEQNLAICEIGNARFSESKKSVLFDRLNRKDDFKSGKIELEYAANDQLAAKHNWFVDDAGKACKPGDDNCNVVVPKMFGLQNGRGIYA